VFASIQKRAAKLMSGGKKTERRTEEERRFAAVPVAPVGMLGEVPDATVQIGTAPDGLPLLLSVRRSVDVISPVLGALGRAQLKDVDGAVQKLLQELHARVSLQRRELGVLRNNKEGVYITDASVPSLVGTTLFARMVNNTSPLTDDGAYGGRYDAANSGDVRTCAGVVKSMTEMREALETHNGVRHLAIPLDDKKGAFVVTTNQVNDRLVAKPRPFVLESLARFSTARAHFTAYDANGDLRESWVTEIGGDEYKDKLAHESLTGITVGRDDLIVRVHELCADIEAMHRGQKKIHGDIKPANVLFMSGGARSFDPAGTPLGDVSIAGTPSWSAPEQIMALPVTPATDVYALGLLLARVIGATIYGEQRTFTIPVSGQRRVRTELLTEPEAFIDPTAIELADAGYAAYRALLKDALAFKPEKRIQTPLAFAERLAVVRAQFPIGSADVHVPLPGTLARDVVMPDGTLTSARLLNDHCTGHAARMVAEVKRAIAA
jgi:hypothetical protein